jgi:hypothetical protein
MSIFTSGIGNIATPYRDGKILVVPSGCSLPATCVKCGSPVSGKLLAKTFRWHSAGWYFLIFLGLIFYVIAALIVQKKVRIDVPLCDAHRSWRTGMNIAGAVLLVGLIPLSFLLMFANVNGGVVALLAIAMVLAGLVVFAIVGSSFTSISIDESCAKFRGAGEQFLSSLPDRPVSPLACRPAS